ncbi:MAG: hypothetical protein HYX91_01745 [Chloroflexi bacterium]|nr:hypothetical protein [Chloroflexota bacterium]
MNYVFCPSYGALFFALHLRNSGREASVITDNPGIRKYCRHAGISCIYFDYINIPALRPHRAFTVRRRMDGIVKQIGVKSADVFYLLDNTIDISAFYLARKWSKKGKVYFNVLGRKFPPYRAEKRLSLSFVARHGLRYWLKVFLGLDLVFLELHRSPAFGIDGKFLEKNKIATLPLDRSLAELQWEAMQKGGVDLGRRDNLISSDGSLAGIIEQDSLTETYKSVLKLPHQFAAKHHPQIANRHPDEYEKVFSHLPELPHYIPVELVLGNVTRSVISVFSTSLVSASRLERLKAISLLDMVRWHDPSYREEIRAWLKKESQDRIIFVKSLEELDKLLGD